MRWLTYSCITTFEREHCLFAVQLLIIVQTMGAKKSCLKYFSFISETLFAQVWMHQKNFTSNLTNKLTWKIGIPIFFSADNKNKHCNNQECKWQSLGCIKMTSFGAKNRDASLTNGHIKLCKHLLRSILDIICGFCGFPHTNQYLTIPNERNTGRSNINMNFYTNDAFYSLKKSFVCTPQIFWFLCHIINFLSVTVQNRAQWIYSNCKFPYLDRTPVTTSFINSHKEILHVCT